MINKGYIMKRLFLLWFIVCGLSAAELPSQWRILPDKGFQVETLPDGLTRVTVRKAARNQGSFEQAVALKPGERYRISTHMKSSVDDLAYLQVKTYKGRKEFRRFNSKPCLVTGQTVSMEFLTPAIDAATLHIRIRNGQEQVGQQVTFGPILVEVVKAEVHTPGRLIIVPTYENCSYYLNLTEKETASGLSVAYRPEGTAEYTAVEPVYLPDERQYRGSLTDLEENRTYEMKFMLGKQVIEQKFTTLNSQVPIDKTIEIDPDGFNGLKITESGTPDAWIRYTTKPGTVLTADTAVPAVIYLVNARYIVLENLTLRGGARQGIWLENCENIQILNCDIASFGRLGIQDLQNDGKFYQNGQSINFDAGININRSGKVLVERCFIHSPRGTANSWFYSHPAGPQAVAVWGTGGVVLRYNDFIGGDRHRWNDGVEGYMNGFENGGFFRDADIYGNMFALGNDDGIELDGGQMNIRVYRNRFEHFLCGISTGPCLLGPSYIFRNLISNLGDETHGALNAFKNSHRRWDKGRLIISNNTISVPHGTGFGGYTGSKPGKLYVNEIKALLGKNIFQTGNGSIAGSGVLTARRSLFNHNQHECLYPNPAVEANFRANGQEKDGIFGPVPFVDAAAGDYRLRPGSPAAQNGFGAFVGDEPLPYRPVPVIVSPQRLRFGANMPLEQTLTVTVGGKNFASSYSIRQSFETDWVTVTPSAGTLKSGDRFNVTVKVDPDRLPAWSRSDAVILLRLENGFSRPVSIAADWSGEVKRNNSGTIQLPILDFTGADKFPRSADGEIYLGSNVQEQLSCEFTVTEAGEYYLFALVRCPVPVNSHNSFKLSLDGDEMLTAKFTFNAGPESGYTGVTRNLGSGRAKHTYERHKLSVGKHKLVIEPRQGQYISKLVFSRNPDLYLR